LEGIEVYAFQNRCCITGLESEEQEDQKNDGERKILGLRGMRTE
jgi:hypothetical protein